MGSLRDGGGWPGCFCVRLEGLWGEIEGCDASLERLSSPRRDQGPTPGQSQVGIEVTATLAGGSRGKRSVGLLLGGCSGLFPLPLEAAELEGEGTVASAGTEGAGPWVAQKS